MARFYASIQGVRGEATRTGSGAIYGHIRGWDSGVKVHGHVTVSGEDEFHVYATTGSNGHGSDLLIGVLTGGRWIPETAEPVRPVKQVA